MLFFGPLEPREVGKVLSSDDVVVITVLSFGGKNGHQPAMKKRYTRKNT